LWYVTPEDRIDYRVYLYEHQLGKAIILDEASNTIVKNKKIAS
jgi:hypothetical protein